MNLRAFTPDLFDGQVADVVVYRQRGDGGAVVPLQVVLRPALAVALEGEEGVVGDDGAVEGADMAGDLRGQIIEGLEGRVGSVCVGAVRIRSA